MTLSEKPTIHERVVLVNATLGAWTEVGADNSPRERRAGRLQLHWPLGDVSKHGDRKVQQHRRPGPDRGHHAPHGTAHAAPFHLQAVVVRVRSHRR